MAFELGYDLLEDLGELERPTIWVSPGLSFSTLLADRLIISLSMEFLSESSEYISLGLPSEALFLMPAKLRLLMMLPLFMSAFMKRPSVI
jgi:hypothetical protein